MQTASEIRVCAISCRMVGCRAMRFRFTVTIDVPRERVFDYLADPANRPQWQSSIQTIHLQSQASPRVGTTWRESVHGGVTFLMEISEFHRPMRWAERISSKSMSGTVAMEFADRRDGTDVTVRVDIRCSGLLRLVDWVGGILLRREMKRDLRRVEAMLHSARAAPYERPAKSAGAWETPLRPAARTETDRQ